MFLVEIPIPRTPRRRRVTSKERDCGTRAKPMAEKSVFPRPLWRLQRRALCWLMWSGRRCHDAKAAAASCRQSALEFPRASFQGSGSYSEALSTNVNAFKHATPARLAFWDVPGWLARGVGGTAATLRPMPRGGEPGDEGSEGCHNRGETTGFS
jgi:hypothetical protein